MYVYVLHKQIVCAYVLDRTVCVYTYYIELFVLGRIVYVYTLGLFVCILDTQCCLGLSVYMY